MADSLENLNKKLDQLLLDFFEKVEALEDVRNALTDSMRSGFLSMSKARYSMGNKSVGEMQYARSMTASTKVFQSGSCSNKEGMNNLKTDLKTFEVVFDANGQEKGNSSVLKNLEENESSGLRQRFGAKSSHEEMQEGHKEAQKEALSVNEKGRKKVTDPLNWFGVLVPSSLKDCQREFKTACRLACEVKQLELELNRIIKDYEKLKEKKKIVQGQSVDIDK